MLERAQRSRVFAIFLAAGLSLAFMFRVGHRQPSVVLIILFTGWVLSPFAALLVAGGRSASWSTASRRILGAVTLGVCVLSPLVYGIVALGPPRAQPAAPFLLVPLLSWFVVAGAAASAWLLGSAAAGGAR